jgi:endoglucanase
MQKALDGAIARGAGDAFGFGFGWAQWDTTTHGAGLSVMASEVDQLTATNTYAQYADRWLSNILGANSWGLSLIFGNGTTFPHCFQHQVANLGPPTDTAGARGAAVEVRTAAARGEASAGCWPVRRTGSTSTPVQGQRRVPRQHGVVSEHRAGDRPDRFVRWRSHARRPTSDEGSEHEEVAYDRHRAIPCARAHRRPAARNIANRRAPVRRGYADQFQAMGILGSLHATFYIVSGFIGDADRLSWAEVVRSTRAATRSPDTVFHEREEAEAVPPRTPSHDWQPSPPMWPRRSRCVPVLLQRAKPSSLRATSGRGVSGDRWRGVRRDDPRWIRRDADATEPEAGTTVATIEAT